eukprot:scaffold4718_cov138-Skeletonema_marinoi.AAC.1
MHSFIVSLHNHLPEAGFSAGINALSPLEKPQDKQLGSEFGEAGKCPCPTADAHSLYSFTMPARAPPLRS